MKFDIFIGIDQTGAVNQQGLPKPLSICIIESIGTKTKCHPIKKIKSLTLDQITDVLNKTISNFNNQKVLICVDTAIGLPHELNTKMNVVFKKISSYKYNDKPYGAITAYNFFNSFLDTKIIPHRIVEKKVSANSVFNLTPYQKNIGCGSYRIIKDLSENTSWFSLWPFEKPKKQFTIAEGYPSFFWNLIFNKKNRDLDFIRSKYPKLILKNLDEADSLILALGALKYQKQIVNFKPNKEIKTEGWILGVQND